MADRKVAIRLGTEGAAQVQNDFAEAQKAGVGAFQAIGAAANDTAEQAGAAADRMAARQQATWAKMAAAAKAGATASANQDAFNGSLGQAGSQQFATVNLDRTTGSARESADAFKALFLAEEEADAAAQKVRAALDPLAAAQLRVAAAVDEARKAVDRGKLSAEDLAAYEKKLTEEVAHVGGAHQGASVQMMMFHSALMRTIDSASSGQHWSTILVQQGNEVMDALSMGSAGMGGKMKAVAEFMSGPWGLAVMGGASVLAMLIPKLFDSASAADQMKEHQAQLGEIIDQTTGRILEQNRALVLNAAAMSAKDAKAARDDADAARNGLLAQGGRSATDFSTNTGSFSVANATTRQDPRIAAALEVFGKNGDGGKLAESLNAIGKADPKLKDRTDQLIGMAAAYVQLDRKAQEGEAQQRVLTGTAKPGDRRIAIGQFGPEKPDPALLDAEAKLAAATTARGRAQAQATIDQINAKKKLDEGAISAKEYLAAMTKADTAVNAASAHVDKHAQSLEREAAAMKVSAAGAFALADAYERGGAAAVIADAQRKGATDATRKGIDQEAQTRRQLALEIGDGAAAAAKSAAQMQDEAAARDRVNKLVAAGVIPASQMNQALGDELSLIPLLNLESAAREKHLDEYAAKLSTLIGWLRGVQTASHNAIAATNALGAIDASKRNVAGLSDQMDFAGRNDTDAKLEIARRAAEREADAQNLEDKDGDPKRSNLVDQRVTEARQQIATEQATDMARMNQEQRDNIILANKQVAIAGLSANRQEVILNHLKVEQTLREKGVDLAGRQAQSILAGADAEVEARQKVAAVTAGMNELRGTGEQLIDDVFNPSNWKSWGDMGKTILRDIEQEMLKLAVINPLKNLLEGGGSLPTISTVLSHLPHFASGTESAPGGLAMLNEIGPELVNLPAGSKVYNAADTRRMLAGNDNGAGGASYHFDLRGAVVTQDLLDQMNAIGQGAAVQGAHGGAQLASRDLARKRRRTLGSGG